MIVEVAGFAVDAQYFKPNQTYLNLPVYNFSELCAQPEKYVFVNDWLDGNRSWEFIHDAGIIRYALLDNELEKLDDVIGNEKIDFIKLTVEGSELNALKGAEKIISAQRPTLTVSLYQKPESILVIPQFLKSIHGGYKIYMRKHSRFSADEFILYTIS